MFEGKNIHYSHADQKPLCSFSRKVCNQRRLNKYGFCVRHILEDPTAPFKRCAYVSKSSRQTCTQPIPKNEERVYCNNHMQVLGMLPKKERKSKKEKQNLGLSSTGCQSNDHGAMSDPGLIQNKVRPRFTVGNSKAKLSASKLPVHSEEMEDVYTFTTENAYDKTNYLSPVVTSVAFPSVPVKEINNLKYNANLSKASSDSGQSSLATIYPELVEKLEKIKPKVDTKVKGKVNNSRTMNNLQTKIAQNKIKDKLKRNQGSSNTSSQSQSPSHSCTSSPSYHFNSSSPSSSLLVSLNSHMQELQTLPAVTKPEQNITKVVSSSSSFKGVSSGSIASQCHLNHLTGLDLQTLNVSLEHLGLPVPNVSDIEQTLKQLVTAATNIPLDGGTSISGAVPVASKCTPSGTLLPTPELVGMLRPTFTPQTGPPPPYSGVHHRPMTTISSMSLPNSSTIDVPKGHHTKPVSSPSSAQLVNAPLVTKQYFPGFPQSVPNIVPISTALIQSPLSIIMSPFPMNQKLTLLTTSSTPSSTSIASPETSVLATVKPSAKDSATQHISRTLKLRSKSQNSSTACKRSVPGFTFPMTFVKPRKFRKVLDDDDIKKLKSTSAINYYKTNKERKIYNHHLICSGIASSDDSELSDCDTLPWQPDWFHASSDEEGVEEDENDYDLRTAKLALGRARFRRQCFQARRSGYMDHSLTKNVFDSTSCLIKGARESTRSTVRCLQELAGVRPKSKDRYKIIGLEKRCCLYRDNEDMQCKNNIVPYTNHCIKHVMYNVDQQLFEYCTAKFADNTQCCHPVIDVKHELPLCMVHGVKVDNFLKAQDAEPKQKRPRKKTKPSALTRPPKKGKKKKKLKKLIHLEKVPYIPAEMEGVEDSEDEPSQSLCKTTVDTDLNKSDTNQTESKEIVKEDSVPAYQLVTTDGTRGTKTERSAVKTDFMSMPKLEKQLLHLSSSAGQLEELVNLASLSDLDSVKMFGELETASKLLEEHDFQEVFNKLPYEAFDIFNNRSGLPSNEELEELEKSLAMVNKELKDSSIEHPSASRSHHDITNQSAQQHLPYPDDSEEFARLIAEDILKRNIGPSQSVHETVTNGDAEESIRAIAQSLSNSGMMLAPEAKPRSQSQEQFNFQVLTNQSVARCHSLPIYTSIDMLYFPPNVAIQSVPVSLAVPATHQLIGVNMSRPPNISQQGQITVVPQNVTVTSRGIMLNELPIASSRPVSQSQVVTHGQRAQPSSQPASIIVPGQPQLTAQQISALIQQAAANLPPLPPYTPRQSQIQTQPVAVSGSKTLASSQMLEQLTRHQEQLGQQRNLLAQQILQQRLAVFTQQMQPLKVTQSSSMSPGFSTVLQQGHIAQLGRLNHGVLQQNFGHNVELIKSTVPTSQMLNTSLNLPTTNISWASPANVTITSPNGIPRLISQTGSKLTVSSMPVKMAVKEAFIDLTDSNDPPPYDVANSCLGKSQPPPSYPAHTSASSVVSGKS